MLCCWRLIWTHHLCPNPRGTPLYQGSDLSRCVSVTCWESLKQLQHTDPFAIDFLGLWWWSRLPGLWFTVDLILLCTRRMNCTIELVFPSMPWEQLWQKVLQLMACIEATTVVTSVCECNSSREFPFAVGKSTSWTFAVSEISNTFISLCMQKDLSLSHDIPGRLPVGSKVQAVWSEDGEWYALSSMESVWLMFFISPSFSKHSLRPWVSCLGWVYGLYFSVHSVCIITSQHNDLKSIVSFSRWTLSDQVAEPSGQYIRSCFLIYYN